MNEINIIGATSALGTRLVPFLSAKGFKIRASFRDERRVPAEWRNLSDVSIAELDLSQPNADFSEFARGTVVWLAHLDQGRFNERETETNLAPFTRFLEYALKNGIARFVFVSSGGSVYGTPRALPIAEDHPRAPLSSYGRAKAAMEDRLSEFSRNFPTAILRPGNIYGFEDPARRCNGIIAAYLSAIRQNETFTLIHEGRTIRDFIHVDDVAAAISAAVESEIGEIVWNVATERGETAANVLAKIIAQSGFAPPNVKHVENPASDVDANVLSIGRILRESEWRPRIDLDRGIAMLIENWLGQDRRTAS